ncbi:LysR family transcriptional regulator [Marinobacter salarius]|jgi:LysR family transcriptional regulator, transcriptional activator for dmlA|uniref:HTH-type transcriptional regulator DmlR n=1 Tax=Marinobacter salarius TaxID=1420917 RepID=A0A1W6K5K8_9GAMM|nr:LysR family transcriptional regulator [Marinobacter salarius]ARM82629.1 HTH-type transcriptional regulator DmlR [Marinobacter salarius]MBJ7299464.1 LysR family transcriptional regulator [Marinobacter salarius]HIO28157.1 LysR family transcriptional regulator [Marinobacter salarius]HIP00226.1 LysR family transcriptional regulator [Marinobacter salarius]|tara:strand:- start:1064 stop:1975 length:912 start_codon:yes stop_codon:yes gene_type:complete
MAAEDSMRFFVSLAQRRSISGAAQELDLSPPAATKRLAQIEDQMGVKLVNRTTRHISLTPEGEIYLEYAQNILSKMEEMQDVIRNQSGTPAGQLNIHAPLGFGRKYIAPLVSEFVTTYPDLAVRLTLSDKHVSPPDDATDIAIRFGDVPDSRLIARKIAPNRRFISASPRYLDKVGRPVVPKDLSSHQAIALRQNDETASLWRLTKDDQTQAIRVPVKLSTNDGHVALQWAIEGHGLLMRAQWDLAKHLRSGELELVLPEYETPPAHIYAVYLQKARLATRISLFLDYLEESFLTKTSTSDYW